MVPPALRALLPSDVDRALQSVDFRSLSVREFGRSTKDCRKSELSVAEQDLILHTNESFVLLKANHERVLRTGEIYLHDWPGARQASGSSFTKRFLVEDLLVRPLMPAPADTWRASR